MPLLSIVVPVYNISGYISACVQSILSQSFQDYEVLLIDDGSTDGSGKACDELSKNNPGKIKTLHKLNGGLSSARNYGMDKANGEYIIFVDGDDELYGEDSLMILADRLLSCREDLVIYCMQKRYLSSNTYEPCRWRDFDISKFTEDKWSAISYMGLSGKFPGSACTYAMRLKLLRDNNLRFVEGGITAEDISWVINCLYIAENIGAINKIVYTYNLERDGSITYVPRLSGVKGIVYAIDNWEQKDVGPEGAGIHNFLCREFCVAMYTMAGIPKKNERDSAKDMLLSRMKILKKSDIFVYRVIYMLLKLFGINAISWVIRKVIQAKSFYVSHRG